jgi:phospholipid/cholesterol/gamma-HCH transport system substrate-binding protein
MEIRARYVLIGVFTLAVLFAGFSFVNWLNNTGTLRNHTLYQVRFESSVSGLLTGSAVLFNGIRVGEVTKLELNSADPRQVQATIAVDQRTPIRIDTVVSMDFLGLTGSPAISLIGGTSERPLVAENGQMPILVADAAASQSMSQAARDVLRRFEGLLAENAQPLRSMIGNLDTFASALARNSDHLDGIVAGLERMTGGATAKARLVTYDLTVPRVGEAAEKPSAAQLVVLDPTALAALDTERVQRASANGAFANLPDAQWSDALPKLVQVKILRSIEDAGRISGVSRPLEGLATDFQLVLDIRKFQLTADGNADVEFGCKIVASNGRIIATRGFRGSVAAESASAPAAVAALDRAFGQAGSDLVAWVGHAVNEPTLPKAALPRRTSGG